MQEGRNEDLKRLTTMLDISENFLKDCIEAQNINTEELLKSFEASGFSDDDLKGLFSIDNTVSFNPFLYLMTELKSSTTNINKIIEYFDQYKLKRQILITYFGVANLIHQDKKLLNPILKPLLGKFDSRMSKYIESANNGHTEELIEYSKKLVNILKFSANRSLDAECYCSVNYNEKVINNCYMKIFLDMVEANKEVKELLKYSELELVHDTEIRGKNLFFEELELYEKVIFDKIVDLTLTDFEANWEDVCDLLDYFVFQDEGELDIEPEYFQKKEDVKSQPKEVKLIEFKPNINISYLNLEKMLKDKIVGQDVVIEHIIQRLKIADFGVSKETGAKAVFLFVGPTGVGKTEVAKIISKNIGPSEDNLIRIDMSEYKESHTVSKLFGAPPGYVGYEDKEKTTVFDKVIANPRAVILLDEIEKAHPQVLDVFLHIFDEGKAKTNKQREVDFSNSLIFMTSNIGTFEANKNPMGFNSNKDGKQNGTYNKALEERLRPEFLNRIDEIIVFNNLGKEAIMTIAHNQIENIKNRIKQNKNIDIDIVLSDEAMELLIDKMHYTRYGAREVRRVIEKDILNEIINLSINNDMHNGVLQVNSLEEELTYNYEEVKVLKKVKPKGLQ
ncbi:MAG: AAA family ATPase [Bacilli bacterium]|nr:AAA family ATPase [Bacilli bacterium]MDD4808497.1 AAA family ATPase [Bacilli bacterium]